MEELYHVTDASNIDDIKANGLKPGADDKIYFTDNIEDAAYLGEVYPTIENPVIVEATVMECHIREGPGDAGDVDEYVKSGRVRPTNLDVIDA